MSSFMCFFSAFSLRYRAEMSRSPVSRSPWPDHWVTSAARKGKERWLYVFTSQQIIISLTELNGGTLDLYLWLYKYTHTYTYKSAYVRAHININIYICTHINVSCHGGNRLELLRERWWTPAVKRSELVWPLFLFFCSWLCLIALLCCSFFFKYSVFVWIIARQNGNKEERRWGGGGGSRLSFYFLFSVVLIAQWHNCFFPLEWCVRVW